jgi:hypothetical protein
MKFSRFARFGHFGFTSKKPRPQPIYESIRDAQGGTVTDDDDGLMPARHYAWAMRIAAAKATLERAKNQAEPLQVRDLLPVQEGMYTLVPGPFETMQERRAALAAKYKLGLPGSFQNVQAQLMFILGADFVAYRPMPSTEAGQSPSTPGTGPGTFKPATNRIKIVKITQSISTGLGAPQWVSFTNYFGDVNPLQVGEEVVVEAGTIGWQEKVTVLGVKPEQFQATFTRAHEPNSLATTAPFPYWLSTQRHHLVVVKNGRANDLELRRKVNELMAVVVRGSSTWDIVEANIGGTQVGPFIPGSGKPYITTIGTITL